MHAYYYIYSIIKIHVPRAHEVKNQRVIAKRTSQIMKYGQDVIIQKRTDDNITHTLIYIHIYTHTYIYIYTQISARDVRSKTGVNINQVMTQPDHCANSGHCILPIVK